MRCVKIKHSDWLRHSNTGNILALYLDGKVPESIAGWMLVVSLKHPLRAIYGSDLRAALALFWQATGRRWVDSVSYWLWANVTHRSEVREIEREMLVGKEGRE